MLDHAVVHHRAIGEVGDRQAHAAGREPELLPKAAGHGGPQGLAGLRVPTAAVRPRAGPGRLGRGPTGEQHPSSPVHEVAREAEVQRRVRAVDGMLGRRTARLSAGVEEDRRARRRDHSQTSTSRRDSINRMLNPAPALTISAVAEETDLSEAVLRSWEQRHGFPQPVRLPSGHRRYTADDVERIRQVVRDRDAGMSLEAAIARVMARADRAEPSIFAGLRRRWTELASHQLSKRAMLAISRAIEDECCAQAERPLLIGSFQRERFYRDSEARWRELARTATPPTSSPTSGAIVCAGGARPSWLSRTMPRCCGNGPWCAMHLTPRPCLAGFERPGRRDGAPRSFEAVWSVNPAVVRDAAGIGAALARRRRPDGRATRASGTRRRMCPP